MASGDEDDPIIEEVSPQFQMNLAEKVDCETQTSTESPQVHGKTLIGVYVLLD